MLITNSQESLLKIKINQTLLAMENLMSTLDQEIEFIEEEKVRKLSKLLGVDKKKIASLSQSEINKDEEAREILDFYTDKIAELADEELHEIELVKRGDELPAGVLKRVVVYVATKRKLSEGDKMAGRHGNKGVVSRILPEEDMPYLEDGTAIDIDLPLAFGFIEGEGTFITPDYRLQEFTYDKVRGIRMPERASI